MTTAAGCIPCETPGDCPDDHNACTTNTCDGGICGSDTAAECVPCDTDADCADGNGCTTDACDEGICANTTVPGCVPCETAAQCGDGNGCTDDTCTESGVCEHSSRPGCVPCSTAADCDDQNPCTTNQCAADGSCAYSAIPGCQRCTTPSDCDDENTCTTESCTGGVCGHTPVDGCPAEICTNGIDDDGDGLVDCADPDCAGQDVCRSPLPREDCNNCIDDDGDGLVDAEDPDCCWKNMTMVVKRMVLKPGNAHGRRLRLKSIYFPMVPPIFSPTSINTRIQISDSEGQIFCQTIPAKYWKSKRHGKVFRFRDKKGLYAGGLRGGKFKIKRNGQVIFRTNGKKLMLRRPVGNSVRVTVAAGDSCSSTTAQLRTKKSRLVFP
jgi:hypothetical protein